MRVADFSFDLPDGLIALRPARPRDSARLLVVTPDGTPVLRDRSVHDLPNLLRRGDALVFNDTRVISAQLTGRRIGRGEAEPQVDVTLHQRVDGSTWRAFVRGARKLEQGDRVRFEAGTRDASPGLMEAEVAEKGDAGEVVLRFDLDGAALDDAISAVGEVPLPPYISGKRRPDAADRADYQTMFAREEGAVAAPTAGLHFTPDLLKRLEGSGISAHAVTLHVGAGTFLPVKADDTSEHRMHAEWGRVPARTAAALNQTREAGGRIVAVGTTSMRLLESATDASGSIRTWEGNTDIFITPGFRFRAVDILMTNFHLPRSTLYMLVSAFSGVQTMRDGYGHAIAAGYRFYSYGDASLLFRAGM